MIVDDGGVPLRSGLRRSFRPSEARAGIHNPCAHDLNAAGYGFRVRATRAPERRRGVIAFTDTRHRFSALDQTRPAATIAILHKEPAMIVTVFRSRLRP